MENGIKEYQITGDLMKGFLGNISYETVVPENNESVEIRFYFGKRLMEHITESDKTAAAKAWLLNMGKAATEIDKDVLIGMEKTEINLSVFHNGAYVGCSHRNEIEKHIFISPNEASDGFIPWNFRGGILRVVLHVYQILNDHTPYELTISGKEGIE